MRFIPACIACVMSISLVGCVIPADDVIVVDDNHPRYHHAPPPPPPHHKPHYRPAPPPPPKPRVIRPYIKPRLDDFDCRDVEPVLNPEEVEETKENTTFLSE